MKTDEAIKTELQDTRESVTFGADRNKDFSKEPMCLSGRGVTRVFHTGKTTTVAVDHGRGLVGQQDIGLEQEDAGDHQALHLTAGQLEGILVRQLLKL